MKAQPASQRPKSKPAAARAGRVAATQKILKIVSPTDGGLPYFDGTPTSETFPSHEELQKVIEQSQLEEDLLHGGIAISAKTEENHKVVFPDFNKLRKELGTDKIDGVNEVLRQRSEGL